MGTKRKTDLFREYSVKLLFPMCWASGLTANEITVLNFLSFGLASVFLFALGHEYLALFIAGIAAMFDYVDGTVARAGRGSKIGAYLDTSLDWLWLMLLIGSISYYHNIMPIGFLALVAVTFGNWVEFNGKVNYKLKFPFGISHLMVIGILVGHAKWGITAIALTQTYRTGRIYLWSIFKG